MAARHPKHDSESAVIEVITNAPLLGNGLFRYIPTKTKSTPHRAVGREHSTDTEKQECAYTSEQGIVS